MNRSDSGTRLSRSTVAHPPVVNQNEWDAALTELTERERAIASLCTSLTLQLKPATSWARSRRSVARFTAAKWAPEAEDRMQARAPMGTAKVGRRQSGNQGLCSSFREADDGVRTRDPQLGKLMLYQLSYVRVPKRVAHPRPIRG